VKSFFNGMGGVMIGVGVYMLHPGLALVLAGICIIALVANKRG